MIGSRTWTAIPSLRKRGNRMEVEILRWLGTRARRSPWVALSWAVLLLGAWLLPTLARYSIRREEVHRSVVCVELGYLWLLVGGWFALSATADIEELLWQVPHARRWRLRGNVLTIAMLLPAIPFWVLGARLDAHAPLGPLLVLGAFLSAHLALLALAVDRLPWKRGRGVVFLALGGWLPAFVPGGPVGPSAWLQAFAGGTSGQGIVGDSALWAGAFGTMIAMALLALALDLARSPAR